MDIGLRIKELRLSKKLSQKQLAEKLGVTQHTLSRYENNLMEPSLKTVVLLADIFDTTTDYLLGRTDFY